MDKKTLTIKDIADTTTGTPDNLRLYAFDVHGIGAAARAARELVDGKKVRLALCTRTPVSAAPVIDEVLTLKIAKIGKSPALRVCNSQGSAMGEESYSAIASWYDEAVDPVVIAAWIAQHCQRECDEWFLLK
jgi:hypothetical protein